MSPTRSVARVGRLLAGDHPEERRLAGAVRADHADDAGGRQRERQVLEEQPVAEALRHALRLDHDVAEPRARAGCGSRRGRASPPPPRRAASRTRRGAPSTSRAAPSALMRTHSSSRCSVRRRADSCFSSTASRACFCSSQRRVVALERDAAAAVELEDPAGDVVEEVPVVRDRDDGALVLGEEALEPADRLGVEVVRRLVEQQQVGRREQQPAERDAPPLAAGERRRRRGRRPAAAARPSRGRAVASSCHASRRSICVLHLRLLGEQRVEVGVGLGELRRRSR